MSRKKVKVQKVRQSHHPVKNENIISLKHSFVKPENQAQEDYIYAINHSRLTFGIGPAGTGKTHIPTALAVLSLAQGRCDKVIVTRPLVTAGEEAGYLPGTLTNKAGPFIRPIYDEMEYYVDSLTIDRLIKLDKIEIAPLGYIRGRTFKNAIIIADEMQNASMKQMKLLLTRIGKHSRVIITGDPDQSDLPKERSGALTYYMNKVKHVDGVSVVHFSKEDVVRDEFVGRLLEALEK